MSAILNLCIGTVYIVLRISNVKPTFFQDRLLSFSYKRSQKNRIYSFLSTKFIIEPKRSLSDLKIFGPIAIDFFSFQIFFVTSKSSVPVLEICALNHNVLVLFQNFLIK